MTDYSKSLIDFIDAAANDYAHYKRCYPDEYFILCQTEIDEWLKQLRAGIMVQPSEIPDNDCGGVEGHARAGSNIFGKEGVKKRKRLAEDGRPNSPCYQVGIESGPQSPTTQQPVGVMVDGLSFSQADVDNLVRIYNCVGMRDDLLESLFRAIKVCKERLRAPKRDRIMDERLINDLDYLLDLSARIAFDDERSGSSQKDHKELKEKRQAFIDQLPNGGSDE